MFGGHAHAGRRRQHRHVLADKFLLHMRPRAALAAALEGKRGLRKPFDRRRIQLECARAAHRIHEGIGDRCDDENLLFADAEQVVIEGARPR